MYQCLNWAIPSRKCLIKAPAKRRNSVYVLMEICIKEVNDSACTYVSRTRPYCALCVRIFCAQIKRQKLSKVLKYSHSFGRRIQLFYFLVNAQTFQSIIIYMDYGIIAREPTQWSYLIWEFFERVYKRSEKVSIFLVLGMLMYIYRSCTR